MPRPRALLACALTAVAALAGCMELLPPELAGPLAGPPAAPPPPASGALEVHYVSVGQGDGVAWRLPSGAIVLFDCGPPASSPDVNPLVVHLRDVVGVPEGGRIHALVASHGHADHIGGCDEVFDVFRVERVYEAWYDGEDRPQAYRRFQDVVARSGAQVFTVRETGALRDERVVAPGDAIDLPPEDVAAGVRATLVWPPRVASRWDGIAETGLVVWLAHGGVTFCFQGDIEAAQEADLAASPLVTPCDTYLVGHHGSRFAGTADWLARLDPERAVVSFGENRYGHPTAEALCRVQQAGAQVYATHRLGTVVARSDGTSVTMEPDAPELQDYCVPGASYW